MKANPFLTLITVLVSLALLIHAAILFFQDKPNLTDQQNKAIEVLSNNVNTTENKTNVDLIKNKDIVFAEDNSPIIKQNQKKSSLLLTHAPSKKNIPTENKESKTKISVNQTEVSLPLHPISIQSKQTNKDRQPIQWATAVYKKSSVYNSNDKIEENSIDYLLSASLSLKNKTKLSALIIAHQDLNATPQEEFSSSSFSISINSHPRSLTLNNSIEYSYGFATGIPVSKNSTKRSSLLLSLAPQFNFTLISKNQKTSLSTTTSLIKNTHEFKTATTGTSNYSHSTKINSVLSHQLHPKLSLSLSGSYQTAWTYENQAREFFSLAEEASFSFNKKLSIALGHSNEGSVLKANQSDLNVGLLDDRQSIYYGAIKYVY